MPKITDKRRLDWITRSTPNGGDVSIPLQDAGGSRFLIRWTPAPFQDPQFDDWVTAKDIRGAIDAAILAELAA